MVDRSFVETIPDVLFIPPLPSPIFTEDYEHFMPLGLLALAASAREAGLKPALFESREPLLNPDAYCRVATRILQHNAPIVGFSTWCHSYPTSLLLAQTLKKLCPEVVILFGGPQASIVDKETLQRFDCVDFVLRGEADKTLPMLISSLMETDRRGLSEVPGLTYRPAGTAAPPARNAMAPLVDCLDSLPVPAYEDLTESTQHVSLDVGRGCPFKCTFCTTNDFFSKSYRVKSPARIIREMDHVFNLYGTTSFNFSHDMFTLNRRYIMSFCEAIRRHQRESRRQYHWTCSARIDCVTEEMLEAMAEAGCKGIFFGVESGSESVQKQIKKHLRIRDSFEIVDACKRHGIDCTSAFIIGFPEETKDDLDSTVRCYLDMASRGAKPQVSLLSLMPETPLYAKYRDQLEFDGNLSDFSGSTTGASETELIRCYPDLFSSFYFLPVEAAERKTLVTLSRCGNFVPNFVNTLSAVWQWLEADMRRCSLVDLIEKRGEQTDSDSNRILIELTRALREYIAGLPESAESRKIMSVLIAEAAMAMVKRKFVTEQLIEARQSTAYGDDFEVDQRSAIVVNSYWTVIDTSYDISDLVRQIAGESHGRGDVVGRYWYLVVATSERKAQLFRMSDQQRVLLTVLADGSVAQFLDDVSYLCDRSRGLEFLARLASLGVLQITPPAATDTCSDSLQAVG